MYSIGKLAKLSHSTVRTLRYYDEIGLLKPSQLSDGGHRYYEENDITKLHYIKVLKDIGFDLTTIHQMIENQHLSHKEALVMQLKVLEIEKVRIEERTRAIRYLLQVSELEEITNWKDVFDEITTHSSSTPNEAFEELWKSHFSSEEVEHLKQLPQVGDDDEMMQSYITLINDVRQKLDFDIKSPEVQELARRWIALLDQMYKGNFQLAQKVLNKHRETKGNIGMYRFDPTIMTFIEQAIAHYMQVNYEGESYEI